jgi:hypothetical protein
VNVPAHSASVEVAELGQHGLHLELREENGQLREEDDPMDVNFASALRGSS